MKSKLHTALLRQSNRLTKESTFSSRNIQQSYSMTTKQAILKQGNQCKR